MKKALVVISFGTSYSDTRKKTIEACENKLRENFYEYDFYRAWTSGMIIEKIKKRDNENIMNPREAFSMLKDLGYTEVYVQSLHIICGEEYDKMCEMIDEYRDDFKKIVVGRPLLSRIEDYDEVSDFISEVTKNDVGENPSNAATVWMGHGTSHRIHPSYAALEYRLNIKNIPSFIGTVEGYPELDEVVELLKRKYVKKIHLRPLMLVAGDHAQNDMAGDEEDSWNNVLLSNGFEVEIHIEGLGEYEFIQNKFVNHLREAIEEDLDEN